MSRSKTAFESELIKWLQDLIAREALQEIINTQSPLDEKCNASIHDVTSKAREERDFRVLRHLDCLKIVPPDDVFFAGVDEAFRPDILCFNPESRTLVVFKVIPEGEDITAVAELGGYEHALRALFPFLGHLDVCFVIVAQQWSVSLLQALSNVSVGVGRDCLALQYKVVETSFTLDLYRTHVPHVFCNSYFARTSLRAIDLYLAEVTPDRAGEDDRLRSLHMNGEHYPPSAVLAAMDTIVRSADRAGSHGFVMLWRDVHEVGCGKWCLTLCVVDPYASCVECREEEMEQRASDLRKFLGVRELELGGSARSLIYDITCNALPFLIDRYLPELSSVDCSWTDKRSELRERAVPVRFDFWGALGQYAREFVCHPAVRKAFLPLAPGELHWSNSALAMPLLDNLVEGAALSIEGIKCGDAFRAGKILGGLYIAALTADTDKRGVNAEAILEWSSFEAIRYALEMKVMCGSTESVDIPMPTLSNVPAENVQSIQHLATWVLNSFIGERHCFHRECFEIGYEGASLFGKLKDVNPGDALHANPADVASKITRLLKEVIRFDATAAGRLRRIVKSARLSDYHRMYSVNVDGDVKPLATDVMPHAKLFQDFPCAIVDEIDKIIPIMRKTASLSEAVRSPATCSLFID